LSSYIANRQSKRIYQYGILRRAEALVRHFAHFECPKASLVLDIGTADGLVARRLRKTYGFACIGVDVRFEHLQAARNNLDLLVQADGRALPFHPSSVDAIISTAVFKHVLDLETLVAECHRVLKAKGKLLVIDPTPLGIRLGLLLKHFSRESIFQILSLNDFEQLLTRYGFFVVSRERFMLTPIPFWGSEALERGLAKIGCDRLFLNQVICAERGDHTT
jgi:SAM-dependent methyltransferase